MSGHGAFTVGNVGSGSAVGHGASTNTNRGSATVDPNINASGRVGNGSAVGHGTFTERGDVPSSTRVGRDTSSPQGDFEADMTQK